MRAAEKASASSLQLKVRKAPQQFSESQARCIVEPEEAIWRMEERLRRQSSLPPLLRQAILVGVRVMLQGRTATTSSSQSRALDSREKMRVRLRGEFGGGRRVRISSLPLLTSTLLSLMQEMVALFKGRDRAGREDFSYM